MMNGPIECACAVCTAHRLQPEIPEHVQNTQLRMEHEGQFRARRRAKVLWCVTLAALVVVGALSALHVLHA
jgi:hypothetical protein